MEASGQQAAGRKPSNSLMETINTFLAGGQRPQGDARSIGWVHCDIKPNNILRNDTCEVKIFDFGQIARLGTVKERIQGTPDYIAPEQVQRKPVDVQTDIYNLGATLYWAARRRPSGSTLYTVNKKGENSFLVDYRIETPQQLNSKVPLPLSNLTMEMITTRKDKQPNDIGRSHHAAGTGQTYYRSRRANPLRSGLDPARPDDFSDIDIDAD